MTDTDRRPLTKTLRRPMFLIPAGLAVVLLVAFLGWSSTCPCDRAPGAYLFGASADGPVTDWGFANEVVLCQIPDPRGALAPRHQPELHVDAQWAAVSELLAVWCQTLVQCRCEQWTGEIAARRHRLSRHRDTSHGPGRARPSLGRAGCRNSTSSTRRPARPHPLLRPDRMAGGPSASSGGASAVLAVRRAHPASHRGRRWDRRTVGCVNEGVQAMGKTVFEYYSNAGAGSRAGWNLGIYRNRSTRQRL